jgi:hypothetical protein
VVEVDVTVLDEAGTPVPKAYVRALGPVADDSSWSPPDAYARTDADGRASLEDLLSTGPYRLKVYPGPERRDLAPVLVDPWVPADREVRLPPGRTVRGVVHGRDGNPLPDGKAHVWVWTRLTGWWRTRATVNGAFEVLGLPEGPVGLAPFAVGCLPHEEPTGLLPEQLPGIVMVTAGDEGVVLRYPMETR